MELPPFQRFLDMHRDTVYRYLVFAAGPQEADDTFQETFVAALRAYPSLRSAENLRGWILKIAHNKAIDAARARGRRPVPVPEPPEPATAMAAPTSDGVDPELWSRVRELPPKQRGAVLLRFVGDLEHTQIARVLDCSEEAARRNLHVGLKRLREEWT
ncbi:MAG: RNA polymerase sigma factor [Solirubrobacteraceae bacterium]